MIATFLGFMLPLSSALRQAGKADRDVAGHRSVQRRTADESVRSDSIVSVDTEGGWNYSLILFGFSKSSDTAVVGGC